LWWLFPVLFFSLLCVTCIGKTGELLVGFFFFSGENSPPFFLQILIKQVLPPRPPPPEFPHFFVLSGPSFFLLRYFGLPFPPLLDLDDFSMSSPLSPDFKSEKPPFFFPGGEAGPLFFFLVNPLPDPSFPRSQLAHNFFSDNSPPLRSRR